MDMWKPFGNVAREKAPQAAILFDKFHIMRHLGEALDKVRKTEYARLRGKDRRFIERDLIRERTRAGLAAAEARRRKGGRKPVITAEKLKRARDIIDKGLTVREAATRPRLMPGVTEIFAHPVLDGEELRGYDVTNADIRVHDAACLTDPSVSDLLDQHGVRRISFRDLRDLQRAG